MNRNKGNFKLLFPYSNDNWDFTGKMRFWKDGDIQFEVEFILGAWELGIFDTFRYLYRKWKKLESLKSRVFIGDDYFVWDDKKPPYIDITCEI